MDYRSEFLSSLILAPTSISMSIIFRSIISEYYRWHRFSLEVDEYSMVTSSKGQCYDHEKLSTDLVHFSFSFISLLCSFIVYQRFTKQISLLGLPGAEEHEELINEAKQIFCALALHMTVFALGLIVIFLNQLSFSENSRPFFVVAMIFPYLWFIVIQSLRSAVYHDDDSSPNTVDISSTISDISSITYLEEGTEGNVSDARTTVCMTTIDRLAGVNDTSSVKVSVCSLLS